MERATPCAALTTQDLRNDCFKSRCLNTRTEKNDYKGQEGTCLTGLVLLRLWILGVFSRFLRKAVIICWKTAVQMATMNGSSEPTEECAFKNHALYMFYAAAMIVIIILALPLNASVLHLLIFKLKFWKSNTINVFLFNLVLADVLLLFCLPIKARDFITGQRSSSNDAIHKAMLFMLFLNRGASIAFLTVITIDRYFKVVHPSQMNVLIVLKKSRHISIIIWLLLLPLTVPTMIKNFECYYSHTTNGKNDNLVEDVVDSMIEVVIFSQILIPFIILAYCTVRIIIRLRRKTVGVQTRLRRAVFLVTIVMVVFSLCFLPCAIARMVLLIVHRQEFDKDVKENTVMVFDGLMVLSYIDCLLDPLVYCFCSRKFKELYISTYCSYFLNKSPVQTSSSLGNPT